MQTSLKHTQPWTLRGISTPEISRLDIAIMDFLVGTTQASPADFEGRLYPCCGFSGSRGRVKFVFFVRFVKTFP